MDTCLKNGINFTRILKKFLIICKLVEENLYNLSKLLNSLTTINASQQSSISVSF